MRSDFARTNQFRILAAKFAIRDLDVATARNCNQPAGCINELSFYAASFSCWHHLLTAFSAALMDLAMGSSKIDRLLRKWLRRLPHAFPPRDRAAGYRYQLSILQAEFSLIQGPDQPVTLDNGIKSCADPKLMQSVCDELSQSLAL